MTIVKVLLLLLLLTMKSVISNSRKVALLIFNILEKKAPFDTFTLQGATRVIITIIIIWGYYNTRPFPKLLISRLHNVAPGHGTADWNWLYLAEIKGSELQYITCE